MVDRPSLPPLSILSFNIVSWSIISVNPFRGPFLEKAPWTPKPGMAYGFMQSTLTSPDWITAGVPVRLSLFTACIRTARPSFR